MHKKVRAIVLGERRLRMSLPPQIPRPIFPWSMSLIGVTAGLNLAIRPPFLDIPMAPRITLPVESSYSTRPGQFFRQMCETVQVGDGRQFKKDQEFEL
jgi:hypothetical protein